MIKTTIISTEYFSITTVINHGIRKKSIQMNDDFRSRSYSSTELINAVIDALNDLRKVIEQEENNI